MNSFGSIMIVLLGNIKPEETDTAIDSTARLESMLNRINREGKGIVSPYAVKENGEFQAVYTGPESVFDHIWLILYQMHPADVHFSLGISSDTINTDADLPLKNDDPVFRHVRKGLERNERGSGIFLFQSVEEPFLPLINQSLILIARIMKNWKKTRFAVLYGLSRSRPVSEIAGLLDISERSVYKNIRAGSLDTILSTVNEISRLLDKDF